MQEMTKPAGVSFRLWEQEKGRQYTGKLCAGVHSEKMGPLFAGEHQEGITYNGSVFFEEFPVTEEGLCPFSLRAA